MNISATELLNFIRKYYISQFPIVTYCSQALRRPAHRKRETVHPLLSYETPDFITPALWPANSVDRNSGHQITMWWPSGNISLWWLPDRNISRSGTGGAA